VPGYVQVVIDGSEYIPPIPSSTEQKTRRVYFEGNPVSVNLTKFERNRSARAKCLHHYGYLCCICQFDFAKTYGELATEMIHVHHLTPISLTRETYLLDPIKDLRPICPNCHVVIHKRYPPFSIEDVKNMVGNAKKAQITKRI
jgi:5-methylcytosine-specific restriction protein A